MGIRFNTKSGTVSPTGGTNLVVAGSGATDDSLLSIGNLAGPLLQNVPSGANTRCGQATLVAGAVTVANTTVTANSLIFLQRAVTPVATRGDVGISAISPGVSFTITSSNAADVDVYNWLIID